MSKAVSFPEVVIARDGLIGNGNCVGGIHRLPTTIPQKLWEFALFDVKDLFTVGEMLLFLLQRPITVLHFTMLTGGFPIP